MRRAARSVLVALTLAAGTIAVGALPVAALEPSGFGYFHTYSEMEAVIDAAVADHPGIARKLSIGRSYHGRQIWAIKLTRNVAAGNQGRPEVLIDGLIHARERASSELAIYLIQLLAGKYGQSSDLGRRVTALLNTRVVYIVPMVNPDGAVYDFQGGAFHSWRKNRQPIPGTSAIGIDLNRSFGFRWGCCGGSSGNPARDTYRGPSPWYAPETVAYRDFIKSRVIGGEQRMTTVLSIHSAGRLVLWPYGYTSLNVPSTMTADDHAAFVALGRGMANRNGYTPQQSSDLYITDGDHDDWAYHSQRIFAITLEMKKGAVRRYYPSKSELAADLARNKLAVLWFLGQADCPYRAAGLGSEYCAASMSSLSVALTTAVHPIRPRLGPRPV